MSRSIDAQAEEILDKARYLVLGIGDEPAPHVVPLFYGQEQGRLYFHCARRGTKLDLLRARPRVSFVAAEEPEIRPGESACRFSARCRSVMGRGVARIVSDDAERIRGLDAIMRHYAASTDPRYSPDDLARTLVVCIDVEEIHARRIG